MHATFAGRTGWTVAALIGLVAILVSGALGYSIWSDYRNMRLRAEQRAVDTARTATEHVRWLVEASRQSLRALDAGLPGSPPVLGRPVAESDLVAVPGNLAAR